MAAQESLNTEDEIPKYHLMGTYTRYSSWTARVETVLKYFSIPYTSTIVPLSEVKTISPSSLVPLLQISSLSNITLNDSLAILLTLSSLEPSHAFFPSHPLLKALALSAVAEMHAGFPYIRGHYHSNFIARYEGVKVGEEGRRECERLVEIWGRLRGTTREVLGDGEDEGFLCGKWGVVDAFFWPVLWRFRTYSLPLDTASPETVAWIRKMWADPKMKEISKSYFRQAENPDTRIEKYEDIFKGDKDIVYSFFEEGWEFEG